MERFTEHDHPDHHGHNHYDHNRDGRNYTGPSHAGHHHAGHNHGTDGGNIKGQRLLFVVILNLLITAVEIIGGVLAGSLSLISDALHNFSDGIALVISFLAMKIASKGHDRQRTFGYKRASILAALLNAVILAAISVFLFKEAFLRFFRPESINGSLVMMVALVGLAANMLGAVLLHGNAKGDMNIRSSYLHLLSDAFSSIAVIIGGILICYFKIYWIDPLLTVGIGLYVLKETWEIIRKAMHILMQGAPENIDIDQVRAVIEEIQGVDSVHHIHIWSLDENTVNFEAHVQIEDLLVSETGEFLVKIENRLRPLGISHITIQFEHDFCHQGKTHQD